MKRLGKVEQTALLLMVGSILSKILGLARELVVAYKFGAGAISDAFLLTNSIPSLIFVSLGTAIGINFIPYYHRIDGKIERDRFTSNLWNISLVIMAIGCLLVITSPHIVLKIFATGLPSDTEKYAVVMLNIVMFSIIPLISCNLFQGYLQVNGRFYSTAVLGIVNNIVVILITLISSDKTYYLLSISTVIANIIGFCIVYYEAKKIGFKYHRLFCITDKHIRVIISLTLPLIAEDLASSMSLLVDRNVASFLEQGVISGLSYAGTISNIAGTMIVSPIITAIFPSFSKMAMEKDKAGLLIGFEKYLRLISFLLCPISAFIVFNARDIVELIFVHGTFDNAASEIVSRCLLCYAMGILPSGIQAYLIKIFYSLQDTKTPVKIKVFSLAANIIMNVSFVKICGYIGIAISTSISYLLAYLMLSSKLKRKYGFLNMSTINNGIVKNFGIAYIAACSVWLLFGAFLQHKYSFIQVLGKGILFLIFYLIGLIILQKNLLLDVKNGIERKDE